MTHSLLPRLSIVAVLVSAAIGMPAAAAANRLPGKPFVYDARQVQLVDLLRDFAGAINVPIVIAEGVAGTANAKFSTSPTAFLDIVSRSFGLIWYYDGTAVHVYPSSRIQSRLLKLTGSLATEAEEKLGAFGLLDGRYPLRFMPTPGGKLMFAFGPPRHIELIDALLEALGDNAVEPGPDTIRAFPLTHASAIDRTVQGMLVPGVVTTLTRLFSQRPDGKGGPGSPPDTTDSKRAVSSSMSETIEGLAAGRAKRYAETQRVARSLSSGGKAGEAAGSDTVMAYTRHSAQTNPEPGRATFTADETTNLVLVRASENLLPDIADIIAKLDVAREMIEVEATIIDVSSDEIESLGFDWQFDSNKAARQVQLSPGTATSTTSGAIPQGTGFNITTLLASGGSQLLARIRALEARGTARVVSQPKVLGAANRMAVLSDKRSASVRVAGNQDAELFSVETGTTLQVTPRWIREGELSRISMELTIEDGGFSSEAVDEVPIAQRTVISTIATLNEGQALLIGGIVVEGSSGGRSGIPWLSSLPVVGPAFRFDTAQSSRRQRLFLITPKRVVLDRGNTAAAAESTRPAGTQ